MNKRLKREILNIFYPNRCPVCGEIISAQARLCESCESKVRIYQGNFRIANASFSAAYEYNENISPAIMLLKDGICGNAAFALGSAIAERLLTDNISADIIIPVPMYKTDERKRGFNQTFLIAKEVSDIMHIPVCRNAVRKIRRTPEQKNLKKKEREINLRNAFEVSDADSIRNKSIILIDDVCTTGSTFSEIVKILIESNAKSVHCASCCKTT